MKKFIYALRAANLFLFLLLVLVIAAGVDGCKKHEQEDKPPTVPPTEKKWIVTTVAGQGTGGFANGPALSAKFNAPADVAIATDGALYVTDTYNHRIRKIMEGRVSTFAGSDSGFVNGNGESAQFMYPFTITLDANGNLYTSDILEYRLRRISPAAEVTTFAIAVAGFFNYDEMGIVADSHGNVYVSDTYNVQVRKINASGELTTIAGNDSAGFRDGSGAAAKFNYPAGIAIDKQGNLYVADPYNFRIRKINPEGLVSTFAGSGVFGFEDGDARSARFNFPVDVVIDSQENLYVADGDRIRKISPQGVVSTIAGSDRGYADGDGASAKFFAPWGLGIDVHGNIYVADTFNNRIRKISFE